MAEQKQIQKKIRFALSSQTSKENLSFVILLKLMSLRGPGLKKLIQASWHHYLNWFTYCVLNHDLFSVYPWEYTVMNSQLI